MNVVRTVLGDIAPGDLGVAYCHEHLIIDSPLIADRFSHIHLPSVADAVREVKGCADAGVTAMVDAMPCAAGRRVAALAEISRTTGVHVVATTGLHTDRYYAGADWTRDASSEELASLFIADIDEGVDLHDYTGPFIRRTEHRAGIVKAATLGERPDSHERTVFEAVAATHHATGAPIITHCEEGRGGLAQVELFADLSVPLDRVLLSHTDKVPDPGYHRDLLGSGVNVEYDQALRRPADDPRGPAWLLEQMLAAGFGDRLMLGTDGARRSLWLTLGGGPGLAWLYTGFVEVLEARGIDASARRALFVENPARFLAF